MKDRRIYISGPITGTDDYTERFARAESELTMEGYSVVNPARVNAQLPADTTYEEYMKMFFTMLDMCGCIYMLDGWQKSRGANREYGYAIANDMVIMRQSGRNVDRQPAEWKDKMFRAFITR